MAAFAITVLSAEAGRRAIGGEPFGSLADIRLI